ncbi:hypothetical protein KC324_g65 [Hortaea werneckii]|nr:hypothetical protein KC324_g65 [Hortaea werneckii]
MHIADETRFKRRVECTSRDIQTLLAWSLSSDGRCFKYSTTVRSGVAIADVASRVPNGRVSKIWSPSFSIALFRANPMVRRSLSATSVDQIGLLANNTRKPVSRSLKKDSRPGVLTLPLSSLVFMGKAELSSRRDRCASSSLELLAITATSERAFRVQVQSGKVAVKCSEQIYKVRLHRV